MLYWNSKLLTKRKLHHARKQRKSHEPPTSPARSAELLRAENAALQATRDAAKASALAGTDILEEPSDEALGHEAAADDNLYRAITAHEMAERASLSFAQEHIGPLVDAALAEATQAGKQIVRK